MDPEKDGFRQLLLRFVETIVYITLRAGRCKLRDSILFGLLFYSVFVLQRMYFVYACSTNVLVNKD